MYQYYRTNSLSHHGIKGQKWGVRRYQNPDGSYKNGQEGRYADEKTRAKKIAKGAAIVAGTALLAYAGYKAYNSPKIASLARNGMAALKGKTNISFKEAQKTYGNSDMLKEQLKKIENVNKIYSSNTISNSSKKVSKNIKKYSNDNSWQSAHEKIDNHFIEGLKQFHPSDTKNRNIYIEAAKKAADKEHKYLKELESHKERYANQVENGFSLPKNKIISEKELDNLLRNKLTKKSK